MGWLNRIFDKTITKIYEIKNYYLSMPKEDELLIFQFPKDTPIIILEEFERNLVEFQNQDRKFIVLDGNIKIIKTNKKQKKECETVGKSN